MKLLYEIRKSAWLIEAEFAGAYMPTVMKLLAGQAITFVPRSEKPDVRLASDEGFNTGFENAKPGSVAVIPIKGPMLKYGTMCEYGTSEISQIINQAADKKEIDGVVLDIDTGGGSVNSVQPLVDAIKYVQSKGKDVAVWGDLIASAGYYVASFANRIYLSSPMSSAVGSIGVYTILVDDSKMLEDMGYKVHEIYPPESNFKNKDVKEAFAGNYELIISEHLSPLAQQFQSVVRENRKKLDQKAEGILNGRMFNATDAVKYGLADEIGTIDKAISFVRGRKLIRN